jgi:mono/diheme cytochrome c family protein
MNVKKQNQFAIMKTFFGAGLLVPFVLALLTLVTGCDSGKPATEYMPDMYESTSFKAQKEDPFSKDGSSLRVPPEGTIPRGYEPYHFAADQGDEAGKVMKNPLPRTKAIMERGQKMFDTYCIVCHGPKGDGQGFIVPPFPRPPSLLSDKVRTWTDGRIFHVITRGQNLMPSYAVQLEVDDRWAIINYVRALQRAAQPTPEDLKEMGSPAK